MRRRYCALYLAFLTFAGCDGATFLSPPGTSGGKPASDRVVKASLASVSQTTQESLRSLGLKMSVSQLEDVVRISSTTAAGSHFAFVLRGVGSPGGDVTQVHIDWDKPEDAKANGKIVQVLADLELVGPRKASPPS